MGVLEDSIRAALAGDSGAQRQLEAYVEQDPSAAESCLALVSSGIDPASRHFAAAMVLAAARKGRFPPGPLWETALGVGTAPTAAPEDTGARRHLLAALAAAAARAGGGPALSLCSRAAGAPQASAVALLTAVAEEQGRLSGIGGRGAPEGISAAQAGPLLAVVRSTLGGALAAGDVTGATAAMGCLAAWASCVPCSLSALGGGVDDDPATRDIGVAALVAACVSAAEGAVASSAGAAGTAAAAAAMAAAAGGVAGLLGGCADLLEASAEASRAAGEPWSPQVRLACLPWPFGLPRGPWGGCSSSWGGGRCEDM